MFFNGGLGLDEDSSAPEDVPSRGWAIGAGVGLVPVYFIFSIFGLVGKGTVATIALGTLVLAVRMHLEYVDRLWFWCVIALVAGVDLALLAFVPFPNSNYAFPLVGPFGYLECLLISALIRFTGRWIQDK